MGSPLPGNLIWLLPVATSLGMRCSVDFLCCSISDAKNSICTEEANLLQRYLHLVVLSDIGHDQ